MYKSDKKVEICPKKNVGKVEKCRKSWKMSKMSKKLKNVEKVEKCQKSWKMSKKVEKCQKSRKMSKMLKN